MGNIESVLKLERILFEKIAFNRTGMKNNKETEFSIRIQIGKIKENFSKVTLILLGHKEKEYDLEVALSGFFSFRLDEETLEKEEEEMLLNKNAVAILMPYLRSEVTLLTAQPEMDCVVLPPFNINRMMDQNNHNEIKTT
ncbi:MAG: protein-export chaperone SecB [Clostridiales bacterium]|nr:protein-export chaperone SecB [Clostridiales bacterium]